MERNLSKGQANPFTLPRLNQLKLEVVPSSVQLQALDFFRLYWSNFSLARPSEGLDSLAGLVGSVRVGLHFEYRTVPPKRESYLRRFPRT